jgi:hypothetical protein
MSRYDDRILGAFESIDRTLKRIAQVLEDEHNKPWMEWKNGFNLIPVSDIAVSEDNENGPH